MMSCSISLKRSALALCVAILLMAGCLPRSQGRSVVVTNYRSEPVILKLVGLGDEGERIPANTSFVSRYMMTSDDIEVLDEKSGKVLLSVKPPELGPYVHHNRVILLEVR